MDPTIAQRLEICNSQANYYGTTFRFSGVFEIQEQYNQ